ncbi:MAG: hypothetical protein KDA44_04645 [Planctomycetales bacterium]|nr:hypothetical protein [Planctomycetales bacterium]
MAPPDPAKTDRTHSLGRRFDLVTILIVTTLWGGVLALLHVLDVPDENTAFVAGCLVAAAAGQILLDPWGHPRSASLIASVIYTFGFALAVDGLGFLRVFRDIPSFLFELIVPGVLFGYLAGVTIAAAPLLASALRRRRTHSRSSDDFDSMEE